MHTPSSKVLPTSLTQTFQLADFGVDIEKIATVV